MLREVSLCAPGKAVEPRGIALSMGAAKEHEGDELDVPELDELPPSVHEDGPRDPLARERVEGPRGEPDDLHAGDWDDELPNDRSGFDASVASDLPLEAFLGIDDDRGLEHGDTRGFGDDDAAGSDDLGLFEALAHAEVDEPLAVDDLGIDEDLRTPVDDGGAEGTSEDIAAEVNEEDLPELDQDDGGAFELDDLMRELRAGGLGHEGDGDGWVLYDGWGARVPCFAIAIDGGRVLAAGDELLFVEPGTHLARTASLPRRATAIAASPDGAVVGTARGVLLAPALGRPGSLGALAPTMSLLDSDLPVRAIAVFAGRTWALVGGELWLVGSPPAPPILARSGVLAMATARDSLVVLSGSTERLLERFRGDDGDWEPIPLPPEARAMLALSEASTISVCAEGQTLALSGPTGGWTDPASIRLREPPNASSPIHPAKTFLIRCPRPS